jgi:hypothetical protein
MYRFRRNLGQWPQNEPALVHAGVGNSKARLINEPLPEQQDIDIDDTRAEANGPGASHPLLDLLDCGQQFAGGECRPDFLDGVDETGWSLSAGSVSMSEEV